MTESSLTRGLLVRLRHDFRDAVIIKHSDSYSSGIPDISFTWNGKTMWLEIKFANPRILDRGVQALAMKRMAIAGICYYVIYTKTSTKIISPEVLEHWSDTDGFWSNTISHGLVSDFIRMRLGASDYHRS